MGRNRLDFPERSVAYLYADERGSVIAVTDSTGAVLNRTGYDEYGLFTEANSSYASRFKYTGQAYIPEMGMYYYKARMYSPTLGRFMQTDPIGYGDGANMYNYVHSDPLNFTDPSGKISAFQCQQAQLTAMSRAMKGTSDPGDAIIIMARAGCPQAHPQIPGVTGADCDYGNCNSFVQSPRVGAGTAALPGEVRLDGIGQAQSGQSGTLEANEKKGSGRRGPTSRCPGLDGVPCGAPTGAGGTNPDYPNVCPQCLDRNGKWPFGDDPEPDSLKRKLVTGGVVVVGGLVIIGGLILAPQITIPALLVGGAASQ